MHHLVHSLKHDDAVRERLENYENHKKVFATAPVRIAIFGPLLAGCGEIATGSCFALEADSKAEFVAPNNGGPFVNSGSRNLVAIHSFDMRGDNQ